MSTWDEAPNPITPGNAANMPVFPVVTAVVGPAEGLIAQALADVEDILLARRCADSAELIGAVQAGIGSVAVVSSDLPGFDRSLVRMLHDEDVEVVAINDPEDQFAAGRIQALGVKYSVRADLIAKELVVALRAAVTFRLDESTTERTELDEAEMTIRREDISRARTEMNVPVLEEDPEDNLAVTTDRLSVAQLASPLSVHVDTVTRDDGISSDAEEPEKTSPILVLDRVPNSPQDSTADVHDPERNQKGRVIAVWSGHGAPGRSTVAAGLATALAQGVGASASTGGGDSHKSGLFSRRRSRGAVEVSDMLPPVEAASTLLIDADTYAPALAQVLGMLEESSGLALACRHANQGTLTTSTLQQAALKVSDRLDLLSGLPRVSRWTEITGHGIEAVIDQARQDYAWTVLDCAPPTETDEMLSFDTRAPQRNGATVATLEAADLVVIVGRADPVGIKRLISAVSEFRESPYSDRPCVIVVNQAPTRVTGKDRRAQIERALKRFANEDPPFFIAVDPKAAQGALDVGKAVTESNARGEIGASINALAALIAGGFQSTVSRRAT